MGETGEHYERTNKEDKHLKMQNISISLRQPLAEFVINCPLSDCISSLLPEVYLNAKNHFLNTVKPYLKTLKKLQ